MLGNDHQDDLNHQLSGSKNSKEVGYSPLNSIYQGNTPDFNNFK